MSIPAFDLPAGGSAAHNPDLSWSQVRETILMLGLTVAQIRQAMQESAVSLDSLTHAFAGMHSTIGEVRATIEAELAGQPAGTTLLARIGEVDGHSMQALIALQFYDRLTQRLDHACGSIAALADLVADPQRLFAPAEWLVLQQRIRSQYTMEQERELFDNILQGMKLSEALQHVTAPSDTPLNAGDIEMF
ncbi:hypothetical protein [Chitinilyticum litopenaei]|uniref:hypothetical protein n=1 Tax=Chitinilyticum litopenaei TaxID=1121276 RepID=UPI0004249577|nr:hypothetical protein [Chitinilyticum litopenaei]